MRILSVILLGIAALCLYLAASASLVCIRGAILGRSIGAFVVFMTIGWVVVGFFLGLGMAFARRGGRARAAAVTILVGLVLALGVWLSFGLLLLSPVFDATLPPGHDYRSAARAALTGAAVLVILGIPIGLRLRRAGPIASPGDGVTGLPQ